MGLPLDIAVYEIWSESGGNPRNMRDLPLNGSGSALIYGPSGCGKTLLADSFFSLSKRKCFRPSQAEIRRAPEKVLSSLLEKAKRVGSSGVLIENIDEVFARLSVSPSLQSPPFGDLKELSDNSVVLATTNDPDSLLVGEIAVFEYFIPVYYPDASLREVFLAAHCSSTPLDADVDLFEIAALTQWWSPKELRELVHGAKVDNRGTITQASLLERNRVMAIDVVAAQRQERMRQLIRFTIDHCKSTYILEDLSMRFAAEFEQAKEVSASPEVAVDLSTMAQQLRASRKSERESAQPSHQR